MTGKKKQPTRAVSFCEYVVGTTISSALGPIPTKPRKKRDVLTVEVLTDDETEEDTIEITYPRSGRRSKSRTTADAAVKKVRFEETPKKSALKKAASSESEDTPADSESEISAESTDSKADDSASPKTEKSKNSKEKGKEAPKPSESDDDSEPHPTCKCPKCIRGRQKQQREAKKGSKNCKASDSDTDVTTDEESAKGQKKDKTKGKTKDKEKEKEESKVNSSDGESLDESAKDTDDSDGQKKKPNKQQEKKKKGGNKDANKNEGEQKDDEKSGKKPKGKQPEKEPDKKEEEPKKEKDAEKKTSPKEKATESKKESRYPTPFPGPHPRRPNLIAPMRAEVIHTERVIETPEDPLPNAYYDAQHNIVRIYHGPVYGHHHQSLYPKRDPSLRPLPIGMPHPTQNQYYHGFDRAPDKTGMEHVPITQGMAMPAWNAFAPVGYPGYPAPFPTAPWPTMEAGAQNHGQNKGAFSMVNAPPAAAPSSKDQDIAGGNNVFPPGKENPYLVKRGKSQFSNYAGSNRSAPNGSPRNSNAGKADAPGQINQPQQSEWGNGSANGNGNGNGNGGDATGWNNQTQDNTWGGSNNGGQSASQPFESGGNQESTWNNDNNGNGGGSDWPTDQGQSNSGNGGWKNQDTQNGGASNGGQWGDTGQQDNGPPPAEAHNNVMPGGWDAAAETPSWGDTTMAASTGGKVDQAW